LKFIEIIGIYARFFFVMMQEFEKMDAAAGHAGDNLLKIEVANEISDEALNIYEKWCHETLFVPSNPNAVKGLCGDGHEKVMVKLGSCEQAPKRGGRPRTDRRSKRFNNGWFMVSDAGSGHIVSVKPMVNPENYDVVFSAIERVIDFYPKADMFIYDRACKTVKKGLLRPKLKQIKTWCVDKFHAKKGHSDRCACSPYNHKHLMKKLKGMNTSTSEQIFSWFRGYASSFNNMRPCRHRLMVLYYCGKHNHMLQEGDTQHLNPFSARKQKFVIKKKSVSYHCRVVRKRPAAKAVRRSIMKKPAAKDVRRSIMKKPAAK
jgi:hypothetical protein